MPNETLDKPSWCSLRKEIQEQQRTSKFRHKEGDWPNLSKIECDSIQEFEQTNQPTYHIGEDKQENCYTIQGKNK